MLHACVQRFDVTGNLEKFCKILGTKHYLEMTRGSQISVLKIERLKDRL